MLLKVKPMLGLVTILALSAACQKNDSKSKTESQEAVNITSADFTGELKFSDKEFTKAYEAAGFTCVYNEIDPRIVQGVSYQRSTLGASFANRIHFTGSDSSTVRSVSENSVVVDESHSQKATFNGAELNFTRSSVRIDSCENKDGNKSCSSKEENIKYSGPTDFSIPGVEELTKEKGKDCETVSGSDHKPQYEVGTLLLSNGQKVKAIKTIYSGPVKEKCKDGVELNYNRKSEHISADLPKLGTGYGCGLQVYFASETTELDGRQRTAYLDVLSNIVLPEGLTFEMFMKRKASKVEKEEKAQVPAVEDKKEEPKKEENAKPATPKKEPAKKQAVASK